MVHDIAAFFISPVFKITDEEVHRLAVKYATWRQYYDPPKDPGAPIEALLGLAWVGLQIEGPKIKAFQADMAEKRRVQAAMKATGGMSNPAAPVRGNPFAMPTAANVVQMPTP